MNDRRLVVYRLRNLGRRVIPILSYLFTPRQSLILRDCWVQCDRTLERQNRHRSINKCKSTKPNTHLVNFTGSCRVSLRNTLSGRSLDRAYVKFQSSLMRKIKFHHHSASNYEHLVLFLDARILPDKERN
jgi:hypothetical protein